MSEFLIITGVSGAGGSTAGDTFEDLGWFVIDNLPPALIGKVVELVQQPGSTTQRVALVVRTEHYLEELATALEQLRKSQARVRVLFLEASDEVLVRRYENTRRRHPMSGADRVSEAIERERALLEEVKSEADVVVDTSNLNVHQLRDRLLELFARETEAPLQTNIISFGYKHGLPLDVDIVLDCRFLPNPFWEERLRRLSGLTAQVRDFVLGQPEAGPFLDRVEELLVLLIPAFEREGKSYLTIAFGCTGGQHRSVAVAEELAARLRRRGVEPRVNHRDLPALGLARATG